MKKMMKRLFCTVLVLLLCITSVPLTNVEAAEENMIPDDAKYFNGHWYKVYDISKSWTNAKAYCENLGGHLVTITSREENDFIKKLIIESPAPSSSNIFWIGASDSDVEGVWKWVTNEPFSYTNWGTNEPDNIDGADFCTIYRTKVQGTNRDGSKFTVDIGQWDDYAIYKNDTVYFICEWENIYNLGEETYSFENYVDRDSKGGHCFGMSMTSAGYYLGILDVSGVGVSSCQEIHTLSDNETVRNPICYYQGIQGSLRDSTMVAGGTKYKDSNSIDIAGDWAEVVNYVRDHEYDNSGVLQIGFLLHNGGGHAVNFLRYEEETGYIYVYDNNFPEYEQPIMPSTDGKVYTVYGEIDSITLRYIPNYFLLTSVKENVDKIIKLSIYAVAGSISIIGAIPYIMEMGSDSDYYVYEVSDDISKIKIIPLNDNATFTYMGKEYSFNKIDETTYAEFTLSTSEEDTPEFEIINEPHEHIYDETKTEPTCIETGSLTYTCSCGASYTETIPALGHTSSSWITDLAPTCTAEGSKHTECTVCEEVLETEAIEKLPHNYNSVVTEATCEAGGFTTYTCSCGDTYTDDKTPAKGHNYVEGVCENCGESKVDNCTHLCHKSGFLGFIWKIVRFIIRLFRVSPVCDCGISHY